MKGPRAARERRFAEMRRLGVELARRDFDARYGDLRLAPIVVIVAAYLEADNIGDVTKGIPSEVEGVSTTTLVVIDGGDDGTEEIVAEHGALYAKLPANLGHGIALRLGYEIALARGAEYIVTLDADGQNDPGEIPELVAPLLADESDFVIGSRRLGVDHTSNRLRKAGVVVFASVISTLIGRHLTDTSSGLRAIKAGVLRSVQLEQEQYQTAELIISAAAHDWRISEQPTVWRMRASGLSRKGSNLLYGPRYAAVIARTWLREHGGSG